MAAFYPDLPGETLPCPAPAALPRPPLALGEMPASLGALAGSDSLDRSSGGDQLSEGDSNDTPVRGSGDEKLYDINEKRDAGHASVAIGSPGTAYGSGNSLLFGVDSRSTVREHFGLARKAPSSPAVGRTGIARARRGSSGQGKCYDCGMSTGLHWLSGQPESLAKRPCREPAMHTP